MNAKNKLSNKSGKGGKRYGNDDVRWQGTGSR
jgi:hypothetical protein